MDMTLALEPQTFVPQGTQDFRISQPQEIFTLLQQMAEQNILLGLTAACGVTYTTTIWEVDRVRRLLCLGAEPDRRLERIVQADDALAAGYLDRVKIQFDAHHLMQVRADDGGSVLTCRFPHELYRFQRRSNFRVRPLHNPPPVARFRSGAKAERVELRVIDISVTGVALLVPAGLLSIAGGDRLVEVDVELDIDTRFTVTLNVMHVSPLKQSVPGGRMGCEMEGLSGIALRSLQRFIDHTQKRRRAMAWSDC
jgi:c-di-GMP-binding flagellar brake protein YcgR